MKHYTRLPSRDKRFSPVSVLMEWNGSRLKGELVHTAKAALELSFPNDSAIPSDESAIESLAIRMASDTVVLRNARVMTVMRGPSETTVRVETADPLSRSRIWNLGYELTYLSDAEPPKEESTEYFEVPLRGHYAPAKCEERLDWLKSLTGQNLENVGRYRVDPVRLKGNVENFVGCVEIPVGLAGPLLFNGQHTRGYVIAPYATTEGALVASASRGAKALSLGGGVRTFTIAQQMMRAPVFVTNTIADAHRLQRFINDHKDEILHEIRLVSRRARLVNIETYQLGNALHVRFIYETGDAAGQNMTTAATWKACQWILAQTAVYLGIEVKQFMVESNMSGDKKVNYLSYISGRGIRVTAEAHISDKVLRSVLKVSADELESAFTTFMSGSLNTGMVGFNINIANTIAAIFTATGQDIACVHESSIGQLHIQKQDDGVYVSLLLPSLIIGTVGGGTGLPTQQDCLRMMGCGGADKVFRLAEIIAGYCLALDLSTLSAIASGQFASAHEKLGRNHPEDGLQDRHLTPEFFNTTLQNIPQFASDIGLHVTKIDSLNLDTQNSILSELTSTSLRKKVGHFAYDVHWENPRTSGVRRIVIKAKPTDSEIMNMINGMAQGCGNKLARVHELFKRETGFRKCHIREMELYRLEDEHFKRFMPEVFYTWRDDDHEIFAIAMEYLEEVRLKDSVMDVGLWSDDDIRLVLRDAAEMHAVFFGKTDALSRKDWIDMMDRDRMITMTPLWKTLLDQNHQEFPDLFGGERYKILSTVIENIPEYWKILETAPKTLIHNDFNLRNICLRQKEGDWILCAYDWELATVHVPQRDVCEFLAFVLPPERSFSERMEFVEFYRKELENRIGKPVEKEAFHRVYHAACLDFAVNRLQLYGMAHTFKDYEFLPRVVGSHYAYLQSMQVT